MQPMHPSCNNEWWAKNFCPTNVSPFVNTRVDRYSALNSQRYNTTCLPHACNWQPALTRVGRRSASGAGMYSSWRQRYVLRLGAQRRTPTLLRQACVTLRIQVKCLHTFGGSTPDTVRLKTGEERSRRGPADCLTFGPMKDNEREVVGAGCLN